MLVVLFLDIDGVLHPYAPWPHDASVRALYFMRLPRLESVLRDFPHVRVVIASDWRLHHTLDQLRAFFSEDIRERVIGTTAIERTDDVLGNRQAQAQRYLREQGWSSAHWIAIDDTEHNYMPEAPLVLCKNMFGEREEAALRLLLERLV